MFVGPWKHIYIMFMSYVDQWPPMYTDLGRPGDTFAVAGDAEQSSCTSLLLAMERFIILA